MLMILSSKAEAVIVEGGVAVAEREAVREGGDRDRGEGVVGSASEHVVREDEGIDQLREGTALGLAEGDRAVIVTQAACDLPDVEKSRLAEGDGALDQNLLGDVPVRGETTSKVVIVLLPATAELADDRGERFGVRGGLNEAAVVGGDLKERIGLAGAPGGFEDPKIFVDGAVAMRSERLALVADRGAEVALPRNENAYDRSAVVERAGRGWALVTVEAADPLEEYVHRAEVGEEQVGVEVEALLDGLGGDEDTTLPLRAALAEADLNGGVEKAAVDAGESSVVRGDDIADAEEEAAVDGR